MGRWWYDFQWMSREKLLRALRDVHPADHRKPALELALELTEAFPHG